METGYPWYKITDTIHKVLIHCKYLFTIPLLSAGYFRKKASELLNRHTISLGGCSFITLLRFCYNELVISVTSVENFARLISLWTTTKSSLRDQKE